MKCRLGCWRSASSPSPKPTASGLCFSAAGDGEPTASPSTMKSPASNSRSSAFFYAVLLALVVVAAWADYRDTETAVRNEAKAPADLHLRPAALVALTALVAIVLDFPFA